MNLTAPLFFFAQVLFAQALKSKPAPLRPLRVFTRRAYLRPQFPSLPRRNCRPDPRPSRKDPCPADWPEARKRQGHRTGSRVWGRSGHLSAVPVSESAPVPFPESVSAAVPVSVLVSDSGTVLVSDPVVVPAADHVSALSFFSLPGLPFAPAFSGRVSLLFP